MLAACLVFAAQNALATIAMKYNTIGMVSVLLYLAIPMGYALDRIFLGQHFGWMELGGAAIICVVNLSIAVLRLSDIID